MLSSRRRTKGQIGSGLSKGAALLFLKMSPLASATNRRHFRVLPVLTAVLLACNVLSAAAVDEPQGNPYVREYEHPSGGDAVADKSTEGFYEYVFDSPDNTELD